mgnify:CR=1 FL=1
MPRNDTSEDGAETSASGSGGGHDTGRTSRRAVIAGSGAVLAGSIAGCLGGGAGQSGATATGTDSDPWTTEDLAAEVEDGTTVTVYAANGDRPTWKSLVEVINDEFDVTLELDQYNAHAGAVSQRFMQEHQAGSPKADVVTTANDITAQIREDGMSVAEEYYETGLDEDFWFAEELDDDEVYPWMAHALNGGAWSVMPISEDVFEERGLDYPDTYNDLFDDQYEGLEVALPGYIVDNQVGWIMDYHADETDMDTMEWMETLIDHLNFVGVESHSTGARAVAQGDTPMMFYNFPSTIQPLMGEYPLRANIVDPVFGSAWKTELCINKNAPNPWAARFFVSATLEPAVQRRIATEVPQVAPGRTDLDYSSVDMSPYMEKRLNANAIAYTFEETDPFIETGQKAKDEGVFDY